LILRRQFMRDDLLARAWVGRVVADDEHGLWLWVPAGSVWADIGAADGRSFREVPFADWGHTPKTMRTGTWQGSMLMLHPPDAYWSVWLQFAPDGAFRSWYVNLEEPVTRWDDGAAGADDPGWATDAAAGDTGAGAQGGGGAAGVDTVDYDLDIVVGPDLRWSWKDEDEFAAHLAVPGVYWVDDEAAVRAAGERAVRLVEAGSFPFDGTRTDFRPDPLWTVPTRLPAGWDRGRARSVD